jgi:hypothetical protein
MRQGQLEEARMPYPEQLNEEAEEFTPGAAVPSSRAYVAHFADGEPTLLELEEGDEFPSEILDVTVMSWTTQVDATATRYLPHHPIPYNGKYYAWFQAAVHSSPIHLRAGGRRFAATVGTRDVMYWTLYQRDN